MNSQNHAGQPGESIHDLDVLTAPVIDPVTVGGWYRCQDDSWARFAWIGGRVTLLEVAPEPPPAFNPVDEDGNYSSAAHWDYHDSMDQIDGDY